jgi:riboflavin synthase
MFTGIIESMAKIIGITPKGSNITFRLASTLASEFKPDQSISHNGCCLTVEVVGDAWYEVTAIDETLKKSNLGLCKINDYLNIERSMQLGARLDGHLVQGHVDGVGTCVAIEPLDGSTLFSFNYPEAFKKLMVEKGSICLNGISLTVFNCTDNFFTVGIIPYTLSHTNISALKIGDPVNLEFDILGKYVQRNLINHVS